VIAGKRESLRNAIFTAYRDVQRAVRQENWKLIVYPKINKVQLFDLANDPDEVRDLYGDLAHAERLRKLAHLLHAEQTAYGDTVDQRSEKPEKAEVDLSFFKSVPKKKK
jgi:arylsulfatase A-like enzyme